MTREIAGRALAPGEADGVPLVLAAPLSFWGGVDPVTGVIVDPRHPDHGTSLAGRVVVLPAVRGSSSSGSVLAELIRAGSAPRGIILGEADEILAVGSIVAAQLYDVTCPVTLVELRHYEDITRARSIRIERSGRIVIND